MAQSIGMIDLQTYLTYEGVTTKLDQGPDGWNEESIQWVRDMRYGGLFREFTMPLQFVGTGAYILRQAFYTYGVNAVVTVMVEKRHRITNLFQEKFTGVIDFGTFNDTFDYVEVQCIEGGVSADIKRRFETKYDIPFTYSASRHGAVVQFQGQVSNFETFTWISPMQRDDDEVYVPPTPPGNAIRTFIVDFEDHDFKDINDGTLHLANYKIDPSYTWAIVIDRDCELKFNISPGSRHYELKYLAGYASGPFTYKEEIIMDRGGVETILDTIVTDSVLFIPVADTWTAYYPASTGSLDHPLSGNYSFLAGDKITIRVTIECTSALPIGYQARFVNNSCYVWRVQIFDRLSAISLQAWKPIDLFEDIVKQIGNYPVKSDFLETHPVLIIPSEACRESLALTAITHTSLHEFFMSYFVTEEIGIGIEQIAGVDTVVIEPLDYFFDETSLSDIGNVVDFALQPATDLLVSEIDIGFAKQAFKDYFGKQEYHGSSLWTTPIERIDKKESWISPYRGDILGIDQIRLKQLSLTKQSSTATETKDTDDDLVNFLLDCKFDYTSGIIDYYTVNRDYITTGIEYSTTIGNVRFTPRRCMLRHNHFLRSICHLLDSENLQHVSGTQYYNFFSWGPGEPYYPPPSGLPIETSETADILISDLLTPIFKPYYFTFRAKSPYALVDAAMVNRYGMFSFIYRGDTYYGFIVSCAAKLAKEASGEHKLLCANITDLTKLIV